MVAALLTVPVLLSSAFLLAPCGRCTQRPLTVAMKQAVERPDLIRTDLPLEKRKEVAKARRAVKSEGLGGFSVRKQGKRTEQKKARSGKGFGKTGVELNYDRRPSAGADCMCGSGKLYSECCAPFHDGAHASTPVELVRSRFTALK